MEQRWYEIQSIWNSNQFLYVIAGFLVGILFFPAIEALSSGASELLSGFVPEAVGIAFTVLLIDRLNRRRDAFEQEKREATLKLAELIALKHRLIQQMGSQVNAVAIRAVEELRDHHWYDLSGAYMQEANLTKAVLIGMDFADAFLDHTNFSEADLTGANLEDVFAMDADFGQAILTGTNLSRANLKGANLKDAILEGYTYMWPGSEDTVSYTKAHFDEWTILPDDSNWTPETDMTRFTDPNHPDFWEPEWVKAKRESI